MKNMRDFKEFVLEELRKSGLSREEFIDLSDNNLLFWAKLNEIGGRNIEKQPPETVPDIDATVELSETEWAELETEFRRLKLK